MLKILAYHRVGTGKHSNSLEMMRAHLSFIKAHYHTILPGDPIKSSILLSFDDATFDFYHYTYPLLKEFDLKALLAVPTHYIVEETKLATEERLAVPYTMAMQEGIFETKAPFCTWQEIEEMVNSGHVEVAAHSHLHCNLTFGFVDLEREIVKPKKILEERLPQTVSSFVYPFGRSNKRVHAFVQTHYPYAFRLGFGYNRGWCSQKAPLKRIICDHLHTPKPPLNKLSYYIKTFI